MYANFSKIEALIVVPDVTS